jgi:hypothetical protein
MSVPTLNKLATIKIHNITKIGNVDQKLVSPKTITFLFSHALSYNDFIDGSWEHLVNIHDTTLLVLNKTTGAVRAEVKQLRKIAEAQNVDYIRFTNWK